MVVAAAQRQRKIIPQHPFVFRKERPSGLLESLIGQAIIQLRIPPLEANSGHVVTQRHNKLAIQHRIGGFQLTRGTANNAGEALIGNTLFTGNRTASGFSGVTH